MQLLVDQDRGAAGLAIVAAILIAASAYWQWWRISYDGGMETKGWAKLVLGLSIALNVLALVLVFIRFA